MPAVAALLLLQPSELLEQAAVLFPVSLHLERQYQRWSSLHFYWSCWIRLGIDVFVSDVAEELMLFLSRRSGEDISLVNRVGAGRQHRCFRRL